MNNEDTRIFEAVRNCCRTRILFPGMHVDELEAEVKDIMIDQWNPLSIKDQKKTLIVEPTETTREVVTNGVKQRRVPLPARPELLLQRAVACPMAYPGSGVGRTRIAMPFLWQMAAA